MKNVKTYRIVCLLFATTFLACSKDDDGNSNSSAQNSADLVEQIAEDGSWRITRFVDSGQDETNDFTGYTFQFETNGLITATNGNRTVEGNWSVLDDDSNSSSDDDGNSTDDDDFNIFFPVPATDDFEDLNDDWDIISVSNTQIELLDISGGNGGTDYLTFQKN